MRRRRGRMRGREKMMRRGIEGVLPILTLMQKAGER